MTGPAEPGGVPRAEHKVDVDVLRGLFLFEDLDRERLEWLAAHGVQQEFAAGEPIVRQGDPAERFVVLVEGEIVMVTETPAGTVTMTPTSQPGAYAGAISAYLGDRAPENYTHSLRATKPTRMFVLPAERFRWMMTEWFPMAVHLLDGVRMGGMAQRELIDRRQRLTALGTITAGLTHELNNPAAAAVRAVGDLRDKIRMSRRRLAELAESGIEPERLRALVDLQETCAESVGEVPKRSPLETSDAEDELSDALEDAGVEDAWDIAPPLVGAGFTVDVLEKVRGAAGDRHLNAAVHWMAEAIEISQMLNEVTDATERISSLIASAKQYSQMDRAPYQTVDVRELLDSTLTMFRGKIPPGISLATDYDPALPPVPAYAGELNQVWSNLIHNALDAMGSTGTLTVRTRLEHDTVALIEVCDTGPGVPEELRERIFEPFFTTKAVGEGTGLGLDISFRIVSGRHGGDLRVESRPGDTRFQVRLPLAETPSTAGTS
ncbi:signal transduction histidine kinase [Streptosporangium becharense]|uniref:histidine kinase n=1 Tax=Streptosporangium becharense TaxID=1816182 RepID=A0A7W9IDT6_9ACTN|nr:ATP-binding protein [Streptosporangium becharense]MBB2912325.1 signal transduction histidine kinase [Streptosporangium becharense]MBB5818872.1 signal transduction histidine kinase [Streptosporangium becharense]